MLTNRLREAREAKGLTQRELARLCQLGMNQITRYENGTSDPASETLGVIARELSVSADYLLGLTDEPQGIAVPNDIKPDEREVLDTYRRDGWLGLIWLGGDRLSKQPS